MQNARTAIVRIIIPVDYGGAGWGGMAANEPQSQDLNPDLALSIQQGF